MLQSQAITKWPTAKNSKTYQMINNSNGSEVNWSYDCGNPRDVNLNKQFSCRNPSKHAGLELGIVPPARQWWIRSFCGISEICLYIVRRDNKMPGYKWTLQREQTRLRTVIVRITVYHRAIRTCFHFRCAADGCIESKQTEKRVR